jgi:hypothetical protein
MANTMNMHIRIQQCRRRSKTALISVVYCLVFLLAAQTSQTSAFITSTTTSRIKQQCTPRIHTTTELTPITSTRRLPLVVRWGWVQRDDGEWEWQEDDPNYEPPTTTTTTTAVQPEESSATPTLPSGSFRPKQSLGQNFLKDGNTVAKMLRAFHQDATLTRQEDPKVIIELGPGAGALTDPLVKTYGTDVLQCIEVDPRSVELLQEKHPSLTVHYEDVLQVDYPQMAESQGQPLIIVGNLPYYITSQILFALADASHLGAVDCATVTMQWEVAQRMVAPTRCKVR